MWLCAVDEFAAAIAHAPAALQSLSKTKCECTFSVCTNETLKSWQQEHAPEAAIHSSHSRLLVDRQIAFSPVSAIGSHRPLANILRIRRIASNGIIPNGPSSKSSEKSNESHRWTIEPARACLLFFDFAIISSFNSLASSSPLKDFSTNELFSLRIRATANAETY